MTSHLRAEQPHRWKAASLAVLLGAGVLAIGPQSPAMAYPRPGTTTRVSVDSQGHELIGRIGSPAVSDDGRFVAFESTDPGLAPNGGILLHDRLTGSTERVAPHLGGATTPSISADGRFVAFDSFHDVSHPDPPGGFTKLRDIFVYDRHTGATEQVSVTSDGGLPNNFSRRPTISADGRFVAFASPATNLVPNDTNGLSDVFVKDRSTGVTERVSVADDETEGTGASGIAFASISISADGRYVAFESDATNLVARDLNLQADIFVRDRETGTTERVSIRTDGAEGDGSSQHPSISGDGRFVAFDSWAQNLVPGDGDRCTYLPTGGPLAAGTTCGDADVFVHDRQTETTDRISVTSDGRSGRAGPRGGNSWAAAITDDGRQVAFFSSAVNFVPGDTNDAGDVFVHDRISGVTERVSVASDGTEGNGPSDGVFGSTNPVGFSGDGRFLAFRSAATNLDADDTNGKEDVFVRDRGLAFGVNDLAIERSGDTLTASGWATFTGEPVSSADDPVGDGGAAAEEVGGDLVHTSLIHRPEHENLLVRMRVTSLPSLLLSVQRRRVNGGVGAPGVTYGLVFTSEGVRYEVRGTRDPAAVLEDGPPDPIGAPPGPNFALFRCEPDCVHTRRLSGAIGTTGNEVRFSIPLEGLGTGPVLELSDVRATTSFTPRVGDVIPFDVVSLPNASIRPPSVELAVAPASASEEDVVYTTEADIAEGLFSEDLDTTGLAAGEYLLWARACFAEDCTARSLSFTVGDQLVQTTLSLAVERVRGDFVVTATLTETTSGSPISGAAILFSINGEAIGSTATDETGQARLTVHSSRLKPHDVLRAEFGGDTSYAPSWGEITTRG